MSRAAASQEALEKASIDEKRRRRKRTDGEGRTYSCSCGKSYLSYAALYTHNKTKHAGKTVNGELSENSRSKNSGHLVLNDTLQQSLGPAMSTKEHKDFLNAQFPDEEDPAPEYHLPFDKTNLLDSFRRNWEDRNREEKLNSAIVIDQVFGNYLSIVEPELSPYARLFLQTLILQMRNIINASQKNNTFTANYSAENLPDLANEIALQLIRRPVTSTNPQLPQLRNPLVICKSLLFFCCWLYEERYSDKWLKLNEHDNRSQFPRAS